MGMAKDQCWFLLYEKVRETRQVLDIHVQRVETAFALQQAVAEKTAPSARTKLRIAPDFGDRLSKTPAAPFVRTQNARPLPLPAFLVKEDFQRNTRGA